MGTVGRKIHSVRRTVAMENFKVNGKLGIKLSFDGTLFSFMRQSCIESGTIEGKEQKYGCQLAI